MKKSFLSNQAKEFRLKYEIRNSQSRGTRSYQKNLIVEEFKEFLEAEAHLYRDNPTVTAEALKELADLVYVCYQYAENMNWFLDEALNRVHESNMSKLGEDGKPIYREDGKVLKGPNYKPPDLSDLL
jgi:predicted HAD superfamily Cof-like phosphohydrolase